MAPPMPFTAAAPVAALAAVVVCATACASGPPSALAPAAPSAASSAASPDALTRWLLTWHRPVPADAAGLAAWEAEAGAIAGVTLRRAAAVSETLVAVTLACDGEAACAAARERLRADPRVRDLVPDARRRAASP
jgi:hypothetical protein